MALTGEHLIDGNWKKSGTKFSAINPTTGEALEPAFCEATDQEVSGALDAAARAFDAAQSLPPRWPADLLDRVADEIVNIGPALIERGNAETALPAGRLNVERDRTVGQLRMFANLVREGSWVDATIDTADAARKPAPKPDIRRMLRSRGPVAVFGASNFPFAFGVVGGDTASALAAGNPVIVKGHPLHPGTSECFARAVAVAIESLNLPRGLFSLLQGREHELSQQLVQHPAAAAVAFTGSKKAGGILFEKIKARPRPIPIYAEMGSLNPLILLPNAMRQHGQTIAKELASSVLLGGGQFCTKPGVICLVGDADPFLEMLSGHIAAAAPVNMLGHWVRDSLAVRAKEWSKLPGVTVLAAPASSGYASVSAALFETTAENFLKLSALHEEAFGPAALVVRCREFEDVYKVLQAIGGSLTGTIHTAPGDDPRPLIKSLESLVGRIIINGYPTGVEVCNAMVHGGPYPVTTDPATTSVGAAAIRRFVKMVAYQNMPNELLPPALQNANPLGITRMVNGKLSSKGIG